VQEESERSFLVNEQAATDLSIDTWTSLAFQIGTLDKYFDADSNHAEELAMGRTTLAMHGTSVVVF
jgi:hypothetical protein